MSFIFNTKDLQKALKDVSGTLGGKSDMPVLSCVLLRRTDDGACMTTTSLIASTVRSVSCEGEGFNVAIPHKELSAIVGRARGQTVEIELKEAPRVVDKGPDVGVVVVRSGNARSEISTIDHEIFPTIDIACADQSFVIRSTDLLAALDYAGYAMSSDEGRPHLCGLHMSMDRASNELTCVATDGHRLITKNIGKIDADFEEIKEGITINREGALSLQNALRGRDCDVTLSVGRQIYAKMDDVAFGFAIIDSTFPNFRQVIPYFGDRSKIVFSVKDMLTAIGDVMPSVSRDTMSILVHLSAKGCSLSSKNDNASTVVKIGDLGWTGDDLTFGINAGYLTETLRASTRESVKMYVEGALKPIIIQCEGADDSGISVVMPMRV